MNLPIRVLVVDDSAFMRKMISEMLSGTADILVIDKARNGAEAVVKAKALKPDVITMDVEMPVMTGIEALQQIMKHSPCKVIMVSSVTKSGAEATIRAMEYGAFDFISKPSGSISLDIVKVKDRLLELIRHAAEIKVSKIVSAAPSNAVMSAKPISYTQKATKSPGFGGIVTIGTSTGGPKALQLLLTKLPAHFPYPILIVQHMPKGFTKSLSQRLNQLAQIEVKEAEEGEILKKGVAYIAPGGYHLTIQKIGTSVAIQLDHSNLVNGHRPSVDVMFQSIASQRIQKVIAVIMTGMGQDGKNGLIALHDAVSTTILAESEATSVVFGMPKAAISTTYVDEICDIDQMAHSLLKYCSFQEA